MTVRRTEPVVRAHEMGIDKRYFNLIATGRKTTEIRVNDSSRKKIKEGALIRFRCQGDAVLTRVTNVARYTNFEEKFDHESISSVNPLATRNEQLANIRRATTWRVVLRPASGGTRAGARKATPRSEFADSFLENSAASGPARRSPQVAAGGDQLAPRFSSVRG